MIYNGNRIRFKRLFVLKNFYNVRNHREILPRSKKKVFLPNPDKKRYEIPKPKPLGPYLEKKFGPRKNKLGIQMLSKAMYNQVFKEGYQSTANEKLLESCQKELLKHNMISKESDFQKDIDFKIPALIGENIEEHFYHIGNQQSQPYKELILQLLENIPEAPETWIMQEGWMRYAPGQEPKSVAYPLEEALVFDIEVCMSAGKAPTLATAVSNKAWYTWVSRSVISAASKPVTTHQYPITSLIPIESDEADTGLDLSDYQLKPKVIVGHNVSYDRARIKEQYWIEKTGTRFVDTMSLHVCIGGLTSYQRAILKSEKFDEEDESWRNCSSLNNLKDVYKLYCGKSLKKDTREVFVEGSLLDIQCDFQKVMKYCCEDVKATYEVLKELFPLFLDRFPHPVTFAGMLELNTAYLPVNDSWFKYISESEQSYEDLENEGKILLARRADQACQLLHNEKYKEDIWMWDQNWTVKDIKLKATKVKKKRVKEEIKVDVSKNLLDDEEEENLLEKKFEYLLETKENLSNVKTLLPGYPNWYRKLCTKPILPDWTPGPNLISTSMQITPKLLSLTWEGYPLHYLREKGWGFLVPFSDDLELEHRIPLAKLLEKCPLLVSNTEGNASEALTTISKSVDDYLMKKEYYSRMKKDETGGAYRGAGIWCNTILEECCWFFKLPHKNGASYNVGNPLAKDFLNKFSENVLAGDTESAEQVLSITKNLSYWRNNRDRIKEQMVVWLNDYPRNWLEKGQSFGAIVPQVVVCGTLTRRAVEPTWMTASNANSERIGSELRAMVQAPPGHSIVGADVDSQELWIASVLGDAQHAKLHGATPFGWMTLSGSKSSGTDMHSVTAKAVGISRDHAKVINYARIYGAGQNFAERLLKQFNPTMSESEARGKARKMFALTKGNKVYFLKREYLTDFVDTKYSKWQAFEMAKMHGKSVQEMFEKSRWEGGTESAMFNRLEDIANSDKPCTPFLNGRLSRALEPRSVVEDRYLPTRVNWVVQSGAADFLHLMLVCMRWIMKDRVRFCLSFHDEVRYLTKEENKYRAALALHVTNLLTRSFCAYRLGLRDLPQSVAFFSAVEVDKVLRKDAKQDCVTPSNPHGLTKGYGIGNGEELDIYQAVEKAGGMYSCWYQNRLETSDVQSDQKKARPSGADARRLFTSDGKPADRQGAKQSRKQPSRSRNSR